MLGAGDAMRLGTSKRIACPNSSSKTLGEGPHEILIGITITAEEAVAGIRGIRDEMRQTSPDKKVTRLTIRTIRIQEM